jgi:chromosome segregation ATPase
MLPFTDDDESVIARLEARVGQVAATLEPLRDRCTQLEAQNQSAITERDLALGQADKLRVEVHRLTEELDALRAKQKEAAQRVRALITQIDRLGLFEPPKD